MNKAKWYNLMLILTSLIVYLEWGKDSKMFLWQMELDIVLKSIKNPLTLLHPLVLMPLIGQLALLLTLFQTNPSKKLTYVGVLGLGLLILFIFFIGLIGFKWKIMLYSLPFLILAIVRIIQLRKN